MSHETSGTCVLFSRWEGTFCIRQDICFHANNHWNASGFHDCVVGIDWIPQSLMNLSDVSAFIRDWGWPGFRFGPLSDDTLSLSFPQLVLMDLSHLSSLLEIIWRSKWILLMILETSGLFPRLDLVSWFSLCLDHFTRHIESGVPIWGVERVGVKWWMIWKVLLKILRKF